MTRNNASPYPAAAASAVGRVLRSSSYHRRPRAVHHRRPRAPAGARSFVPRRPSAAMLAAAATNPYCVVLVDEHVLVEPLTQLEVERILRKAVTYAQERGARVVTPLTAEEEEWIVHLKDHLREAVLQPLADLPAGECVTAVVMQSWLMALRAQTTLLVWNTYLVKLAAHLCLLLGMRVRVGDLRAHIDCNILLRLFPEFRPCRSTAPPVAKPPPAMSPTVLSALPPSMRRKLAVDADDRGELDALLSFYSFLRAGIQLFGARHNKCMLISVCGFLSGFEFIMGGGASPPARRRELMYERIGGVTREWRGGRLLRKISKANTVAAAAAPAPEVHVHEVAAVNIDDDNDEATMILFENENEDSAAVTSPSTSSSRSRSSSSGGSSGSPPGSPPPPMLMADMSQEYRCLVERTRRLRAAAEDMVHRAQLSVMHARAAIAQEEFMQQTLAEYERLAATTPTWGATQRNLWLYRRNDEYKRRLAERGATMRRWGEILADRSFLDRIFMEDTTALPRPTPPLCPAAAMAAPPPPAAALSVATGADDDWMDRLLQFY